MARKARTSRASVLATELDKCPNKENHTLVPKGYLQWMNWAEKMEATHRQVQCPGCHRWVIWVKR